MTDTKYVVARTAKTSATQDEIRTSVEEAYDGYKVKKIEDKGDEWEVTLHLADISDLKDVKDDSDSKEDSAEVEESDDDSDSKDSDDSNSDKDGDSDGDKKEKDPVSKIHELLNQLNTLVDDIAGGVDEVSDKANKVDEVHDMLKDHVPEGEMGEVPPGPGMETDGGPVGPGKGPSGPPRPPSAPAGLDKRKRPGGPGIPGGGIPAFTHNRRSRIVFTDPGSSEEVDEAEAFSALSANAKDEGCRIENFHLDADQKRYVAKLVLVEG
jgi:hypothetical protein